MTARHLLRLAAMMAGVCSVASASAADRDHPTVVELFQSQGCSSCPPANANVMALADRPDVLALSFQVTYWDQLGWKDTFAKPPTPRASGTTPTPFATAMSSPLRWWSTAARTSLASAHGEVEALIAQADRGSRGPAIKIAARG